VCYSFIFRLYNNVVPSNVLACLLFPAPLSVSCLDSCGLINLPLPSFSSGYSDQDARSLCFSRRSLCRLQCGGYRNCCYGWREHDRGRCIPTATGCRHPWRRYHFQLHLWQSHSDPIHVLCSVCCRTRFKRHPQRFQLWDQGHRKRNRPVNTLRAASSRELQYDDVVL